MERYTIEQLYKERDNVWIEVDKEKFDKIKKVCKIEFEDIYKNEPLKLFHIFLEHGKHGFMWNCVNGFSQQGKKIIQFSQIDFEENVINNFQLF